MEAYMSMITPYGLAFTIRDWAQCRGQLLSITQFTTLYSLLGTIYGGDGRVSFGLPNLESRSPVGAGQGPGLSFIPQGGVGGWTTAWLSGFNMPAHDHDIEATGQFAALSAGLTVSNDTANTGDPDGHYLGLGVGPVKPYATTLSDPAGLQASVVEIPPRGVMTTGATQIAGASQSFDIRNPYQGVNYQICINGLYPSRS